VHAVGDATSHSDMFSLVTCLLVFLSDYRCSLPQSLIPNTKVCFIVVVHAVSYDYSTSVFLYRYLVH